MRPSIAFHSFSYFQMASESHVPRVTFVAEVRKLVHGKMKKDRFKEILDDWCHGQTWVLFMVL